MINKLHITLNRRWFEMSHPGDEDFLKGTKQEEYREIKPYWETRLKPFIDSGEPFIVVARNGYHKNSPMFQRACKRVRMGLPKPRWTDRPGVVCFILEYDRDYKWGFG